MSYDASSELPMKGRYFVIDDEYAAEATTGPGKYQTIFAP
jgi:hypothetical protein